MKWLLFFCLHIFLIQIVNGQEQNQFSPNIPVAQTYSADSIARYIQTHFNTDKDKLSAIYGWVVANIKYDTDSMYHINWSMYPEEKIAATLRRKRGVCENYAAVFTAIALRCGFQSFVVSGYTRPLASVNNAGHSWCAVSFNNEWFLCDPTWDVGFTGNRKYFLIRPDEFIETHLPFDPLWQLLEHPVSDRDFRKGNLFSKKDEPVFDFMDSVKTFFQLDSLEQLEASGRRITQGGVENDRVKNWLAYNRMKIAIVYGENDMNFYNAAVADLNKANKVFNNFIQYRNNRFTPAKPDAAIKLMLQPIPGLLSSAEQKLQQLSTVVENFQYNTTAINNRIEGLKKRLKEQQIFLNRYLATAELDRVKLFYQ